MRLTMEDYLIWGSRPTGFFGRVWRETARYDELTMRYLSGPRFKDLPPAQRITAVRVFIALTEQPRRR